MAVFSLQLDLAREVNHHFLEKSKRKSGLARKNKVRRLKLLTACNRLAFQQIKNKCKLSFPILGTATEFANWFITLFALLVIGKLCCSIFAFPFTLAKMVPKKHLLNKPFFSFLLDFNGQYKCPGRQYHIWCKKT